MAEQLSLGAVATGQPLSVILTGTACTLPFEHWRELDAITAHNPEAWSKRANAMVLPFDPLDAETEARVRAWATKHRVKLWEGQLQ